MDQLFGLQHRRTDPLNQKSVRNVPISREKTTLFLNLCSGIIITSLFLIIFAHRTPNAGQEQLKRHGDKLRIV